MRKIGKPDRSLNTQKLFLFTVGFKSLYIVNNTTIKMTKEEILDSIRETTNALSEEVSKEDKTDSEKYHSIEVFLNFIKKVKEWKKEISENLDQFDEFGILEVISVYRKASYLANLLHDNLEDYLPPDTVLPVEELDLSEELQEKRGPRLLKERSEIIGKEVEKSLKILVGSSFSEVMYRIEKVKSDALALKEIYKEIPSYRDSYLCEREFPGNLELIKSKVNEVSEKLEDLRTIFTEDN